MKKDGALLLGIGVWNVAIWGNFARNLAKTAARGEQRPAAYYVAHASLVAVDLAIGAVLIDKGVKALRG